jgi:RNA recognition motif-containing protein
MSAETLTATDTVVNDEINPTTTNTEQAEPTTTNGLLHSNGTNNDNINNANTETSEASIEGQVESTKLDDNAQSSFNKSDLEPEALRKVFIGGLSYKTDDQTFREYFSRFGDIDVRQKTTKNIQFIFLNFIRIVS